MSHHKIATPALFSSLRNRFRLGSKARGNEGKLQNGAEAFSVLSKNFLLSLSV